MKKQLLLMVFVIAATLSLAACRTEPAPTAPTPTTPISITGLAPAEPLRICAGLENTVSQTATRQSSTAVTVTIQNNSRWMLGHELPFALEVYDDGQWWSIPSADNVAFPSIAGDGIFPDHSLRCVLVRVEMTLTMFVYCV